MTEQTTVSSPQWQELAGLYGIQLEYEDVYGNRHVASAEAVRAVLKSLGVEVQPDTALSALISQRRRELYGRGLEPVIVAWDGCRDQLELTLPDRRQWGQVELCMELPTGELRRSYQLDSLPRLNGYQLGHERWVSYLLPLPQDLPWGYHELWVETPLGRHHSCLISAPRQAYWPAESEPSSSGVPSPPLDHDRRWGCFLPLYAARSERNWGAGDFTDLDWLSRWVIRHGGNLVGTLPLLATYLEDPCDPSPYAPVSRLFWNEFYVDVEAVPELAECPAARSLMGSAPFQAELDQLRAGEQVQYHRLAKLKRQILQALAEHFFAQPTDRLRLFNEFLRTDAELEAYANFRATAERWGTAWQGWPARLRDGTLRPEDYDPDSRRYHLYVQWLADQQLRAVAAQAAQSGCQLYLDLPLGVRSDSFDTWRFQQTFVSGVYAGAPPDAVWTGGQNWGFPPFHPDQIRLRGYQHLRELLHRQLRIAGFLRIDHVMSLHRLFWIPAGMSPAAGVYVQYRPAEMYAVYSLESHRHQTGIIGENLGTVPPEVNRSMRQHGLRHMHVVEYELEADEGEHRALDAHCIASLNTHDIPMFAAWWQGEDLPMRLELGLFDEEGFQREQTRRQQRRQLLVDRLFAGGWLATREPNLAAVMAAAQQYLAASSAELMLINLEDLHFETRPQNIPGTGAERPNWKRKSARTLEQIEQDPFVIDVLREVRRLRTAIGMNL